MVSFSVSGLSGLVDVLTIAAITIPAELNVLSFTGQMAMLVVCWMQTFAGVLGLKLPEDMGLFASELLQAASTRRELRGESSSAVAQVHACLLRKARLHALSEICFLH